MNTSARVQFYFFYVFFFVCVFIFVYIFFSIALCVFSFFVFFFTDADFLTYIAAWRWSCEVTVQNLPLSPFYDCCRDEAYNKMATLKERREKDMQLHNSEMKELLRIINHDEKMKEFIRIKNNERTEYKQEKAKRDQEERTGSLHHLTRHLTAVFPCSVGFVFLPSCLSPNDTTLSMPWVDAHQTRVCKHKVLQSFLWSANGCCPLHH